MTTNADAAELADKIDPRADRNSARGRWTSTHSIIADADLIAASDMLRTLTTISDEEIAGMVRRLRGPRLSAELGDESLSACSLSDLEDGYDAMVEIAREAADMLRDLHTRLILERSDWRPIETHDGTTKHVMGWNEKIGAHETWFFAPSSRTRDWWIVGIKNRKWHPTHWMPLPEPPTTPDRD